MSIFYTVRSKAIRALMYGFMLAMAAGGTCTAAPPIDTLRLHFYRTPERAEEVKPSLSISGTPTDLDAQLQAMLHELYSRGYLTAWFQMLSDSSQSIHFFTGDMYQWAELTTAGIEPDVLRAIGYDTHDFRQAIFRYTALATLIEKLIDYADNHGHPFAMAFLDSIEIREERIGAKLIFEPGPYFTFDSLHVQSDFTIDDRFLAAYLGIYAGKPFQQALIDELPARLANLAFTNLAGAPEVVFEDGKAQVHLVLQKQKANRLDGILGLLPNENGDGLLLTGQATLDLHNLFASGKQLFFHWQRFNVDSQKLTSAYDHPNLLRSPIGLSAGFRLLKQDSTFLNRDLEIAGYYRAGRGLLLGVKTTLAQSNLLSTRIGAEESSLPNVLDMNVRYYGMYLRSDRLNDPLFPTRGYAWSASAAVGSKSIKKNASLDAGLYEGIEQNSTQYQAYAQGLYYTPLGGPLFAMAEVRAGGLFGEQLFFNEMMRLGGLQSIRGFNEDFFFVTEYALARLEMRALFAEQSYMLLFYDQAMIARRQSSTYTDFPLGVGAGLQLESAAGLFQIIFALGKSKEQAFAFDFAKIHLGYTGRF